MRREGTKQMRMKREIQIMIIIIITDSLTASPVQTYNYLLSFKDL